MGDSFFGFDTSAPPLSEEELRTLRQNNNNNYQDAQDIYDFNTLRHELGGDEPVDDDTLADHLVEEGDDRNDVTFDDAPVGNDFDFSGNTQRMSSSSHTISEEEAFYAKRKQQQQGNNNRSSNAFHNPWAAVREQTPERSSGNGGNGNGFGKTKSIWGNFGSGENNYSPVGSQGSLSPFSGGNRQRQSPFTSSSPLQGMSPSSSYHYQQQQQQQQPVRLEDIEKEMQRQQYRMDATVNSGGGQQQQPMSLAQVEAALAANTRSNQQPQQQEPFGYPQDAVQMMAWKQQQELMEQLALDREMKRRQDSQKVFSKYDGLMTQYDKDYISRIQLSQLATSDPFSDDFYYQVYSSLRQRAGLPTWQSTHTTDRRGKDNMSQRMQQQLQRIVNDAKRRPKLAQVSLEGALGKITSLTVRNPRQVLQVPSSHTEKSNEHHHDETVEAETTTPDATTTPPPTAETKSKVYSKRSVLKLVEDIYSILLELEQMRRQGPPKVQEERNGDAEILAIEASELFRQKYANKLDSLWATLRLSKENNQDVPLLVVILSVPKGKKLIPRIVRQLSNEQNLELLHVVLAHFTKLDVSRNVIYPGTMVADVPEARQQPFVSFEAVELFFSVTMPSLLTLIAESPLQVVNELLQAVGHSVAHSKPGLAFLTMLLSRGEILKQGGGALQGLSPPSAEELNVFRDLYQALFQSLQGRYLSIFPSMYYLVPINPNTPMIQISLGVDDMYVWQFLAALAVGASMEQQHILVTEVRDRVMENIILVKRNRIPLEQANHCIANINLFLHALGLDASQVSVPL
ncbi:hypothetical protein K501DRAFT_216361 [Backusella circina FSU 941]|nr:hypothetical protein K501DRAFT_216361 [Backusella circina FSU 941]